MLPPGAASVLHRANTCLKPSRQVYLHWLKRRFLKRQRGICFKRRLQRKAFKGNPWLSTSWNMAGTLDNFHHVDDPSRPSPGAGSLMTDTFGDTPQMSIVNAGNGDSVSNAVASQLLPLMSIDNGLEREAHTRMPATQRPASSTNQPSAAKGSDTLISPCERNGIASSSYDAENGLHSTPQMSSLSCTVDRCSTPRKRFAA